MKKSKILIGIISICIIINVFYLDSSAGFLLLINNLMILFGLYLNYNRIIDIFSPISIVYIALIISFSMKGLYILEVGKFNDKMLIIPLLYLIIFLGFFNMGLFLRIKKNRRKKKLFENRIIDIDNIIKVSIILLLVACGIYIIKIGTIDLQYILSNLLNNRKQFQNNGGLYFQTIILLLIQTVLYINLILYYKGDKSRSRKLILCLAWIVNIFITFTLGGRGMILTPIVITFFYKFKLTGKVELRKIAIVTVIFVMFSGWYGLYRDGNISIIKSTNELKVTDVVGNVLDRYVQFDNFIRLSNDPIDYKFGKSFLDFLLSPIPRSILPNKPYNFNSQMTKIYHPQQFENLIVTDFTMLSEFYLNFGLFGLAIGGLVFGKLVFWFQRVYDSKSMFFYFWYPFMILKPMSMLYGGMINSTVNMMILLETPILIGLWLIYTKRS